MGSGPLLLVSQAVQLVLSPMQLRHVELQSRHCCSPLPGGRNSPMAHWRVHSPVDSRVASAVHEVHPVGEPSVHVRQEASHETH